MLKIVLDAGPKGKACSRTRKDTIFYPVYDDVLPQIIKEGWLITGNRSMYDRIDEACAHSELVGGEEKLWMTGLDR